MHIERKKDDVRLLSPPHRLRPGVYIHLYIYMYIYLYLYLVSYIYIYIYIERKTMSDFLVLRIAFVQVCEDMYIDIYIYI